ncbi:MAG: sodium:calcium antiporter [Candidatus Heimdallarchaeota archaeon]
MLEILIWVSLFLGGYLVIFFAVDVFLDNLKSLCLIYKLSPFIIGLLVLGIDPEESIASIIAAINRLPYISIGNVIGNSILSLSLCFALPTFFYRINLKSISHFYFVILYSCAVMILFSFLVELGLLIFGSGALLLYFVYIFKSLRDISKKGRLEVIEIRKISDLNKEERILESSKYKKIILVIISLTFIILGGELLILSAENLIDLTGLSQEFFGFIIIAFVTNVEELTLVFKSIKRKSIEIGLGGMIGKVIWNLSFTFGVSGMIALNIEYNWLLMFNWLILVSLIVYYHIRARNESTSLIDPIILSVFLIVFIIFNLIAIGLN